MKIKTNVPYTTIKIVSAFALVFAVLVSTNFLYAAWNAPAVSPPGNNTPTPINVGTTDQVKAGGLSLQSLLVTGNAYIQGGNTSATSSGAVNLEVSGKIGATQFCDSAGTNCFNVAQARAVIDKYKGFSVYTRFAKKYYWGGTSWTGYSYGKRVSLAQAFCNAGDYAVGGRKIEAPNYLTCGASYSQILNLYNTVSPSYFDSVNKPWTTASNGTYHEARAYNGCDRLHRRGSVAAAEVKCLKINLSGF